MKGYFDVELKFKFYADNKKQVRVILKDMLNAITADGALNRWRFKDEEILSVKRNAK
jgi:hypothetical protein